MKKLRTEHQKTMDQLQQQLEGTENQLFRLQEQQHSPNKDSYKDGSHPENGNRPKSEEREQGEVIDTSMKTIVVVSQTWGCFYLERCSVLSSSCEAAFLSGFLITWLTSTISLFACCIYSIKCPKSCKFFQRGCEFGLKCHFISLLYKSLLRSCARGFGPKKVCFHGKSNHRATLLSLCICHSNCLVSWREKKADSSPDHLHCKRCGILLIIGSPIEECIWKN